MWLKVTALPRVALVTEAGDKKPVQRLKEEAALGTAAESTFGRLAAPGYVAYFWSYLAAEDADDYRAGQSVLLDSGVAFS